MNNVEIDVVRQTLELSETVRAGLDYVQNRLEEGSFDEGFEMISNVLQGMSSIWRAMPVIINSLPGQNIENHLDRLRYALAYMEASYVQQLPDQAWAVLETALMPAYQDWQEEMYKSLKTYTFS